jgi:hypothetical protein
MHLPRRVLVVAGTATVLLGAGTAAVAAIAAAAGPVKNGVVNACYKTAAAGNGSHSVLLENTGHKCPHGYSHVQWNQKGKTGPSGVVSMTHYAPDDATLVPGSWGLLGSPPIERFANGKTAAEITATVDEASADGHMIGDLIGICYEPAGGSTVTNVARVQPAFAAAAGSFFAQTVSGVVGNLAAGNYRVGLCAEDQTDVENGFASVTITLAQTASGVSFATTKAAPAQPRTPH